MTSAYLISFFFSYGSANNAIIQSVRSPVSAEKGAYMTKMEFAGVEQQGEGDVLVRIYLISLFWKRKRGSVIGLAGSLEGRIH